MKPLLLAIVALHSSYLFAASPLTRSITVQGKPILANSWNQTLYVFDPDLNAPKPVCTGTCAEKWPPLLLSSEEAQHLSGPLSTVPRENGLLQLTHQGRPVYVYYLDREIGDVLGDGLGGVWHIVDLYKSERP